MKDIKFEEAMKRLEKIVEGLEAGDLSLEDSLKMYEEGVRLSRFCSRKLEEAHKKVKLLSKDNSGILTEDDFQEPAQPKAKKRQDKDREGDLFGS